MHFFYAKIGLALGGGAAKGPAHIGVLKALEEQNITLHAISGTSVGAIIAALYAFGKTPDEIRSLAMDMSIGRFSGFALRKKGFSTTQRLQDLFIETLGDVNIEQAKLPLAIVATNIVTGEKQIFTQGNLAKAVAASTAVPGLFLPVEIDGQEYVDGGIIENVPVSALKPLGANVVIAVNLSGGKHYAAPENAMEVLSNALDIAINAKTREQLRSARVVLSLDLRRFSRTDNREQTDELIALGYRAAFAKQERIRWCLYTPLLQKLIQYYQLITPLAVPSFIRTLRERRQDRLVSKQR